MDKLADSGDAFITFNYDCVIDDSLRRKESGKWNPHYGYAFKFGAKDKGLSGEGFWTPKGSHQNTGREQTIRVHKVHGSLHFREIKNEVVLKERPYGNPKAAIGDMQFPIIPPESGKSYNNGRLGKTHAERQCESVCSQKLESTSEATITDGDPLRMMAPL